jgi:uncharacterized membrane protein
MSKTINKNSSLTYIVLWIIVIVYVVEALLETAIPKLTPVPLEPILLLPFVIIHMWKRYKWKALLFFFVVSFIVSNIFENLSIETGFPFGHYYYTSILGPKLFLVPSLVILAYIAFGYVCWVLSTRLVGDVRRGASALTTFGVPLVASFIFVGYDFCFDPSVSTVRHWWIWQQGGGYFGVPLSNFLGWSLTTFVFFLLFGLYLRQFEMKDSELFTFTKSHYYMAVVVFLGTAATFTVRYLFSSSTQVTDAVGQTWITGNIYETAVIASIYTMFFIAILAAIKIAQSNYKKAPELEPTD